MTDQHPVFDPPPPPGNVEPLLIEEWLPILHLGIDAGRERRAIGHLPPLFTIHLWWARRPVGASQGIQLAALAPPWNDDLLTIDGLREQLDSMSANADDETRYRKWILRLSGILGDNIAGQVAYDAGAPAGDAFPWPKAWQVKPEAVALTVLHRLLKRRWGRLPIVLDPTAGGGSIPYAALRYGLPAVANDLNPVAVASMMGSIAAPEKLGHEARQLIEEWGNTLRAMMREKLAPAFAAHDDGQVPEAYIFANSVTCPRTGGPVPLLPNFWLVRKGKHRQVAVPEYNDSPDGKGVVWTVADQNKISFDPDEGTLSGGDAISPWDHLVIDGDYIKAEAQAGRMVPMLYATKVRGDGRGDWEFRPPKEADYKGIRWAEERLYDLLQGAWADADVVPTEDIGVSNYDRGHRLYGRIRWRDFFTERQLLVHGTFVVSWRELLAAARVELGQDRAEGVFAALAMMAAKALDYNSKSTAWTPPKNGFANTFQTHGYSFKWTFAEYEGADRLWERGLHAELLPYLDTLVDITDVDTTALRMSGEDLDAVPTVPGPLTLTNNSATDLAHLPDGSVECVNIDPPYYENVMYGELADFFYVWEKRTLGQLRPDQFDAELTDKDAEAVANFARFDHLKGTAKKQAANLDYQSKMRDIFAESRRVLRDDGAMVVWFTHKKADAWDTLGAAIMDAGFTIETSWPVNTEAQVSLHQATVNAAKSTIILVCRKRDTRNDDHIVFFEDIVGEIRSAARNAAEDFADVVGTGGVDLLLSTYGPALSVLSSNWPVMSSQADAAGNAIPLRPEEALNVARSEVSRLRIARLVGEARQFDPTTDFVLIAWDTYRAKGFPYDEARKLAFGVGSDVDQLIANKVLTKKSGNVELADPVRRVARRIDEEGPFASLYDAICVMLRKYDLDGAAAVRAWLVERGLDSPGPFRQAVAAYGAAVPRVRGKKGWTLEEARLLDEVAANVPGLELHLADADEEHLAAEQQSMEL